MISKFVREQKRYNQTELQDIFQCSEEKTVDIIKRLKEFGVLKAVKATESQKNMSDLLEEDIEVADVEIGENEYLYVFTFVGVITVWGCVLKCYPKYILTNNDPLTELKTIIKVLEKYNAKEQIIRMYNDNSESSAFNLLAVMIFLLHDYYENGAYTNTKDIIETNGSGEILWDKTINETFTYLSNNRPYYIELFTQKRINDDFDYFKRLHESIISICSRELKDADLLDLFDILPVEVSDEELDDFGEKDYILYRIQNELNLQFNTRKQLLLKTLYAYVAHSSTLAEIDCFTMFGTNSFNLVWEKVCAEVLDNQLQTPLGSLPISLSDGYNPYDLLISLIEKPKWNGYKQDGSEFQKAARETLVPDLVSIHKMNNSHQFIIFDAKYYNIQLEHGKELRGQPGIGDITKQYLYQLAYKNFVNDHGIHDVKNCFLMPTEQHSIINKGYVNIEMLDALGLQNIQIRQLPAELIYSHYLANEKMDIGLLHL
ncbi:LlaJI restriction endonuclease [Schinkia azotoformans MEV2011]|uniref:LlaJI restriction endonuclease n=1 Tax=Schinkia azotoformans MEV2011 TaxID=1348973 RepID=A0A072NS99_SCHAZ|nr:LlaJI family restriction endonuclease [Schinkia azotoformans]KEF36075.1 LlaJI restriction endonuclease [Schinkia azotoformans MEV2011]MEC1726992.1 LlaJI family restriction endonuclease [Schinkia azotoformans]MEC1773345.1 LlaJI family restriction endonuclease [Schinkia azotoformans]MED4366037.1 LlaJI family restriction endonuclease [Schinkia azotoformans]